MRIVHVIGFEGGGRLPSYTYSAHPVTAPQPRFRHSRCSPLLCRDGASHELVQLAYSAPCISNSRNTLLMGSALKSFIWDPIASPITEISKPGWYCLLEWQDDRVNLDLSGWHLLTRPNGCARIRSARAKIGKWIRSWKYLSQPNELRDGSWWTKITGFPVLSRKIAFQHYVRGKGQTTKTTRQICSTPRIAIHAIADVQMNLPLSRRPLGWKGL